MTAEFKLAEGKFQGHTALRWLIEELRVSLFAQELGTAESISTTKLDQAFEDFSLKGSLALPRQIPKVVQKQEPLIAKLAEPGAKKSTIKNLNSLEKFFPKTL